MRVGVTAAVVAGLLTLQVSPAGILALVEYADAFASPRSPAAPSSWREGQGRLVFGGTRGPIYGLAWAPGGHALASTGIGQVNIWGLSAGTRRTFIEHLDLVRDVAWSPDGDLVASASQEGGVRVWNSQALRVVGSFQTGPARAVKWSPSGTRLATGSEYGSFHLLELSSGEVRQTARVQTTISSVSWSPDGDIVAVGGINGLTTLWDAVTGRLVAKTYVSWPERNDVNGVTWSPHGQILVAAYGARGAGGLKFWNPATGAAVQSLPSPSGWLRGVSWSPDGQWIAAGGEDGTVRIWNVETGVVAASLPTNAGPVWSVAWSPDGQRLAAGNTPAAGDDKTGGDVFIWQAPVAVLRGTQASERARVIEAGLLDRGDARSIVSRPTPPSTVLRDGGAHGVLMRGEPPFGNLETSFLEADLRSLGIELRESFEVRCREKTLTVILGTNWSDVGRGEWVAFYSLEGSLIIALNSASAAEASGCNRGDTLFISRRPPM